MAEAQDDQLDRDVDEAIGVCDGDARATVAALLVAYRLLDDEVHRLRRQVSRGYGRSTLIAKVPEEKVSKKVADVPS